ncbi:MAG: arylesterase, partial [Sphingobacterium sp.]
VPPSMGSKYAEEFEAIFPALAKSHQMTLIPFWLDRVAGIPNLNQSDGIHPTQEGQVLVADNIWKYLKTIL